MSAYRCPGENYWTESNIQCASNYIQIFARKLTWYFIGYYIIPREARPKASRSGVYNFVPQRAQAGWNLVWSLRSYLFIYFFIYFFICEVGVRRKWRHTAVRSWPNGVRRRKTQIWGPGVRILQGVFFFFFPFSFLFFFFVSNPEPFLEPFLFFVFLFGLK